MNILQNSKWITQGHNLIKNRQLNIKSRPTMPKANKPEVPYLQ